MKLYEVGFNDDELKEMVNINRELVNITDEDIDNHILFLEELGCKQRHIKNILISNPFYLNRSLEELKDLIKYLNGLGFTYLNLLFDSNPEFLNKDVFEIEEFINKKKNDGISLEDIVDLIDSNPFVIDEE